MEHASTEKSTGLLSFQNDNLCRERADKALRYTLLAAPLYVLDSTDGMARLLAARRTKNSDELAHWHAGMVVARSF